MNRHDALSCLAACLAACVLTGCQLLSNRPVAEDTPPWRPEVFLEYHPFPELTSFGMEDIRPVPAYASWPDARMRRDLERFRELGVTGLLLRVQPPRPGTTATTAVRRLKTFYDLAGELAPQLKLALMLDGNEPLMLDASYLKFQLDIYQFLNHAVAWRPDGGNGVLLCTESISVKDIENLFDLRLWRFGGELPSRPLTLADPTLVSFHKGCAWVMAADAGSCAKGAGRNWQKSWTAPRTGARALESQLDAARRLDCRVVFVASWNCYGDGSFLETNSYDGDAMQQILRKWTGLNAPAAVDRETGE